MSTNVKVFCGGTSEETMVQWPSGKVEFMGWWALLKMMWWVIRTGRNITTVDEDGKESEA